MSDDTAAPSLMDRLSPSDTAWRAGMLVYALVVALLLAWVCASIDRTSEPGIAGTVGFDFGGPDHDRLRPIRRIDPDSGLVAAGAQVGDRVKFDHAMDKYRAMVVGEAIGLWLHPTGRPEAVRHLEVRAIADQDVVANPLAARGISYVQNFSIALSLLTGALLAWRRPQRGPLRVLTFVFVTGAANVGGWLPPGPVQDAYLWLGPATNYVLYLGFAYFCLIYPAERALWDRHRWIRIGFLTVALSILHLHCLRMACGSATSSSSIIPPIATGRWEPTR